MDNLSWVGLKKLLNILKIACNVASSIYFGRYNLVDFQKMGLPEELDA